MPAGFLLARSASTADALREMLASVTDQGPWQSVPRQRRNTLEDCSMERVHLSSVGFIRKPDPPLKGSKKMGQGLCFHERSAPSICISTRARINNLISLSPLPGRSPVLSTQASKAVFFPCRASGKPVPRAWASSCTRTRTPVPRESNCPSNGCKERAFRAEREADGHRGHAFK